MRIDLTGEIELKIVALGFVARVFHLATVNFSPRPNLKRSRRLVRVFSLQKLILPDLIPLYKSPQDTGIPGL